MEAAAAVEHCAADAEFEEIGLEEGGLRQVLATAALLPLQLLRRRSACSSSTAFGRLLGSGCCCWRRGVGFLKVALVVWVELAYSLRRGVGVRPKRALPILLRDVLPIGPNQRPAVAADAPAFFVILPILSHLL